MPMNETNVKVKQIPNIDKCFKGVNYPKSFTWSIPTASHSTLENYHRSFKK